MPTVHIGDTVIATTDDPVIVEGNVYFAESDVADGVLIANRVALTSPPIGRIADDPRTQAVAQQGIYVDFRHGSGPGDQRRRAGPR